MSKGVAETYQRVNITLPEETLRLLDRVSGKGNRSGVIDRAVQHYIETVGARNLRKRLKEGALRRAGRNAGIAKEWFFVDAETWQK